MENNNLVLIAQFCLHHQVEKSFMVSLHEFGLIKIVEVEDEHYLYEDQLKKVEKMIRFHDELGINFEGIDAINALLEQIETLQQELLAVKSRLMIFAPELLEDDNNHLEH